MRPKPVHVISTDTLVEQPLVSAWVNASLGKMREAAATQGLPITPHKLTPEVQDSFWVRLIGAGYPAPREKFRWCTERLKIRPANRFIRDVVRDNGEAILVPGTRRAESQKRAKTTYLAALKERCVVDGLGCSDEVLAKQFRLHLHRGISYLATPQTIRSVADLVRLACQEPG